MRSFESWFVPPVTPLLLLVAAVPMVRAQSPTPEPGPPRFTSLKGTATLMHAGEGAESPATVGLTLSAGDRLVTGGRAGTEVQFDNRVFQLAAGTEIRLFHPQPGYYQLQLDKGSFTCRVLGTTVSAIDVKTPSVSAKPEAAGVYRIAVTAAGESQITAQEGNIEVFAPTGSEWVLAGNKMLAHGPAGNPEYKIVSAVSKWRRFVTVALLSIRVAGDLSASVSSGEAGSRPERKPAAPSSSANNTAAARAPSDKPPLAPKPGEPSRPSPSPAAASRAPDAAKAAAPSAPPAPAARAK